MNALKKLLVTAIGIGFAQTLPARPHYNAWFRTTVSYQVNEKVKADVELQHRRQNGFENDNMLNRNLMYSFRGWLHYQYSTNTGFSVSPFAYFINYPVIRNAAGESAKPFHEIRFSAAVDNRNKITGKWILLERNALEYRIPDNGASCMLRLRNRLGIQYPVTAHLGLLAFDELFCNIAGTAPEYFFDQNRIGLMAEYRISRRLKIETAYLYTIRQQTANDRKLKEQDVSLNLTCYF